MERVTSRYYFETSYSGHDFVGRKAKVILDIDYQSGTYSIIPYCGTKETGFNFINSSHKWKMWKAITNSIDKAIDFANEELKQK